MGEAGIPTTLQTVATMQSQRLQCSKVIANCDKEKQRVQPDGIKR